LQRKFTIAIGDEVYRGLHQKVGRDQISSFIEDLVRPHVVDEDALEAGYRAMAGDEEYERESREWIEADLGEDLEGGGATSIGSTSKRPEAAKSASDDPR
jgi:predicted CopG family antitoxin